MCGRRLGIVVFSDMVCACEQPPFTVQLKDQFGNVVEQQLNASAGEFRFDRVRVIHGQVSFDRRNWTMVHLRDANGYIVMSILSSPSLVHPFRAAVPLSPKLFGRNARDLTWCTLFPQLRHNYEGRKHSGCGAREDSFGEPWTRFIV